MACISYSLKGLAQTCDPNLGGVKRVWIAPWAADAVSASTDTGSTNMMALSSAYTGTGDTCFKVYYIRKGSSSMTSTLNADAANGSSYISTEVALTFARMDTAKRVEMVALTLNDTMVCVEDANGKVWFLGKDEPVIATAGGGATGQAKSDANNYTLTLTDESMEYPYELDAASVALLNGISAT